MKEALPWYYQNREFLPMSISISIQWLMKVRRGHFLVSIFFTLGQVRLGQSLESKGPVGLGYAGLKGRDPPSYFQLFLKIRRLEGFHYLTSTLSESTKACNTSIIRKQNVQNTKQSIGRLSTWPRIYNIIHRQQDGKKEI